MKIIICRILRVKLLLITILCAGTNINAQVLTGIVVDKDTKQPIPDVSVSLEGTSIMGVTEDSGKFTLAIEQMSNTKLVLQHLAYQMLIIESPFNNLPDTIYLEKQMNTLKGVTVRARKRESVRRDLKVNVSNVVDVPTLLEKRPSIHTLVEVLENGNVPNLSIRRESTGEVTVRIERGNKTTSVGIIMKPQKDPLMSGASLDAEPLVVIDGMPVYSFNDANILLNNMENIKSIEILKNGAGWGNRGANGVILIKTIWNPD